LELDQLLRQLIDRAQDVMAAQGRLRALLSANKSLLGDLDLTVVLRRIVEAARTLVKARYGALGVLSPSGDGFEELITVGLDEAQVASIREFPTGHGILGAVIDGPRAIRLSDLGQDKRATGFPEGHPPMSSFLGVPVRVRDEVFGNIYLTDSEAGRFSTDDEELVMALAATAGVVIDNARLFEQARRRQEWLKASAGVTRQLLATGGEDALALIAQEARVLADADLVSVVLPESDGAIMRVEVAAGENAEELIGYCYEAEGTLAQVAVEQRRPLLLIDAATDTHAVHLSKVLDVGPVMTVPLLGTERVRGALVVGRRRGGPRFDEADLEMATTFANQAAVALELADARADQQRMAVLEDRDRIARDLHDHVIQRLFAAGLSVNALARKTSDESGAARLARIAGDLDDTIRQIRTSIFQLRGTIGPDVGTLRARVLEIAGEMAAPLGFQPTVRFRGPVDAVVSGAPVEDVVAVVRESLSNAARHAAATRVEVDVAAEGREVTVLVRDDGVGLPPTGRRSGLANLRRRAEQYGGSLTLGPADYTDGASRGTLVQWVIPLTGSR
jgi:signal transduction histidine kinase